MAVPSGIESIFFAAMERAEEERATFLDGACGSDKELRQRVNRLLQAHQKAADFLSQPIVDRPMLDANLALGPTSKIEATQVWDGVLFNRQWTEETWEVRNELHADIR